MALPAVADLNIEIQKSPTGSLSQIGEVDKTQTSAAYSVVNVAARADQFVDTAELIENEVGVQIRKFGAVGSFSTAVLRGASSQQLMIYLDGVAINTAAIGAVDLSSIDVNDIERIEIYRGTTPVEFGQASIGGAINIVSKKTRNKSATQIKASLGSFSTRQYTLNQNSQQGDARLLISADYLTSQNNYKTLFDNNTEFNLQDDREIRVNNDGVEKKSLLLKWDYELAEQSLFDVRLKYYAKDKQIPNKNNNQDIQTLFTTENMDFLSQYSRAGLLSGHLDMNIKLSSKVSNQLYDDELEQLGFFPQKIAYKTLTNRAQLFSKYSQGENDWRLLMAYSEAAYEFKDKLRSAQRSRNKRREMEFNLQQNSYWLEGSLDINVSLRHRYIKDSLDYAIDMFGALKQQADKQYRITQPQLGMKYFINANSSLIFNYGRYTRVPVFSELFGNQGLFRGNEELKPETGINMDAGVNYKVFRAYHWLHDASIYAGLFYNRADDLIVRIYNSQGISVADNVSSGKITGFEWDIKLYPSNHWNIVFNGTLMNPRAFSERPDANNKIIPGQYRQSYSLYVAYLKSSWKISAQQSLNKDIYWDSPNGRRGDDYYLLDLALSKKWQKHTMALQVNNLSNSLYANFDRVWDRPGRSFFFNYRYTF